MNGEVIFDKLCDLVDARKAVVGVIGLGYVGLPLAMASARGGFKTVGFDMDAAKVSQLNAGVSYIGSVPDTDLLDQIQGRFFEATDNMLRLEECDFVLICVPTPISKHDEPDLSFVLHTCKNILAVLRHGQVIVLESTTHPGTTSEIVRPLLESRGLTSGEHFFIGFSPEREDPGNKLHTTRTIPKIVSGDGAFALELVSNFYASIVEEIVPVSSMDVAEATKITENVFRAVNIALVNELKVVFEPMGVDVWEVISAASTKPFGFMPFYPGPGLGGHCIPIDPFYLAWRAREYGVRTRFIELAGEINSAMPGFVVGKVSEALNSHFGEPLKNTQVLVIGIAYKKDVADLRESPALEILDNLASKGAICHYHDPLITEIPATRRHLALEGLKSADLNEEILQQCSCVLIVTDHEGIDYATIAANARLVIDTRNALRQRNLSTDILINA